MFGQPRPSFDQEPLRSKEAANAEQFELDLEPNRKQLAIEFFDQHLTPDVTRLSGGQYLDLFRKGMDAGFSKAQLEDYLKERSIEIRSTFPEARDSGAISYDTPDNGKY